MLANPSNLYTNAGHGLETATEASEWILGVLTMRMIRRLGLWVHKMSGVPIIHQLTNAFKIKPQSPRTPLSWHHGCHDVPGEQSTGDSGRGTEHFLSSISVCRVPRLSPILLRSSSAVIIVFLLLLLLPPIFLSSSHPRLFSAKSPWTSSPAIARPDKSLTSCAVVAGQNGIQ